MPSGGWVNQAHGGLGSPLLLAVFTWHMVTAFGEIDPMVQDNSQSLQH
jgi:hypothetical protein